MSSRRIDMLKAFTETRDQVLSAVNSGASGLNGGQGDKAGGKASLPRIPARPVRAMSQTLSAIELKNNELEHLLANGATIIEIDAGQLDGSFIPDRFEDDDEAFRLLKDSIAQNGQEVPVLVRPLDHQRYQIAYGHRRVRALKELGRPVRALVKPMSDSELVLAQGIENAVRQDLSWIEKALFAHKLEQSGFDRKVIGQALGVDKTELSRLVQVAAQLPETLVRAIGAAPKAGRPRWQALSVLLQEGRKRKAAERLAQSAPFKQLASDQRFALLLSSLGKADESGRTQPVQISQKGRALAVMSRTASGMRFDLRDDRFAQWLASQLPQLFDTFQGEQPDEQ